MNTIIASQSMPHYLNRSLEALTEWVDGVGLITEEWKSVRGYEGFYEVSSFGRVKSLNFKQKGRIAIVKQWIVPNGYLFVRFWMNKKYTNCLVHRLVAIAFLENPDNKRVVMHKFDNKKDNRIHKLEWGTHKENTQDAVKKGIMDLPGAKSVNATPVALYKDGEYVKSFDCQLDAVAELGITSATMSRAIKLGWKTKGFNVVKLK